MKSAIVTLLFCLLSIQAYASWGPDMGLSVAYMDYSGEAVLLVLPDGSGAPFTEARTIDGYEVDATVYLELYDYGAYPIPDYPWEDIWLESDDNGLVPCVQGTCADYNTDANGMTQWAEPLHAGGYSEENCRVRVSGDTLYSQGLTLFFNSPDINGDLVVNLSDVSHFAGDFFGAYNLRSDFSCDSTINLADLSILAQSMLASCP